MNSPSFNTFLNKTIASGDSNLASVDTVRKIQYPIIYVDKLAEIEVRYLMQKKVLTTTPASENSIGLYIKSNGFIHLGYVEMVLNTFQSLCALASHDIYLKKSKTDEVYYIDLLPSLLLT